MGITCKTNTKKKATLKLFNLINSYLFEQEFGELKDVSNTDINKIKEACKVLASIINKN
jgi:hypothetical protein